MTQLQHPGQVVSNQISFTLSEQQYLKAIHLQIKTRQAIGVYALVSLVIFGAAAQASLLFALGTVLIFMAYIGLLFLIVQQGIRRQFRSLPQLQGPQTMQFSEDGLVWHNDYALSRVKWMIYQKYEADDDMYLLYQGPRLFNIVPRSAFVDAEQEAAFRALLELHVKPAGKTSARRGREV